MSSTFDELIQSEYRARVAKEVWLRKALTSENVEDIMKARTYMKGLEKREKSDFKSILIDPMALNQSFGYRDKPFQISYDVLRAMSKTHVIKSIIKTRKDQIAAFCTPQENKYQPGFIVQKKKKYIYGIDDEEKEPSKAELSRIEDIINFILNCGNTENFWHADDFETFIRKLVGDSLILDQTTFECVRNKKGELIEFFATDGATFRLADSYDDDDFQSKEVVVKGYTPSYVQIYQQNVIAEFYPWELCFGVRNPNTDIYSNGYGKSELEDMIQIITAILNADQYNANFFKVGSNPKGILRYSGNINQNTVDDFREQWIAEVAGVMNSHRIPMINADKMDWISTHVPNKDMEFEKYQEFLIKISCALFTIDPSEIGFPMNGSASSAPMFEGNNEARLKYSQDKGLKPLLRTVEKWVNKYIISQLDKNYELRFVGLDEDSEKSDVELLNQKVGQGMGMKEWRVAVGLPRELAEDDFPLNPIFLQQQQMKMMGNPESNQAMQDNPFFYDDDEGEDNNTQQKIGGENDGGDTQSDNNPFIKALSQELPRILS